MCQVKDIDKRSLFSCGTFSSSIQVILMVNSHALKCTHPRPSPGWCYDLGGLSISLSGPARFLQV